jgi:hypothetical protein
MRYSAEHGVEMSDQFVISKAFHTESIGSEKIRAAFIGSRVLLDTMLISVELDNEFRFEANEVDDIRANGLLTPEFHSCESAITKRCQSLRSTSV